MVDVKKQRFAGEVDGRNGVVEELVGIGCGGGRMFEAMVALVVYLLCTWAPVGYALVVTGRYSRSLRHKRLEVKCLGNAWRQYPGCQAWGVTGRQTVVASRRSVNLE